MSFLGRELGTLIDGTTFRPSFESIRDGPLSSWGGGGWAIFIDIKSFHTLRPRIIFFLADNTKTFLKWKKKNYGSRKHSIMFCHVFPRMIGYCPRINFWKCPKILVLPYHLHAISEILTTCVEFSPCEAFYSVVLTSASMSISKEASFTSTEIWANQVLTKSIDVTYGTWSIALINICQGNANKL